MQIRLRTVCHQFARGRRHEAQWAADILSGGGDGEDGEDSGGNDAGSEEQEEEEKEEEEAASSEEEEVASMQKKPAGVAVVDPKVPAKVIAKKPAAAEAFFYGWNVELQCGYRCPVVKGKAKHGEEEMACPIEEKPPAEDAGDLDEYMAHFIDGDTHTVGKTNAEVRAFIASLKAIGRKTNEVFFPRRTRRQLTISS